MSGENTKVYMKQGGNVQVIANGGKQAVESGGIIDYESGAKQTAAGTQAAAIADHANVNTATTAEIATKQNAILAALRGVGIIAS